MFVVLIAGIAYQFTATGNVTNELPKTTIDVIQDTARPGQYIDISIIPDPGEGVRKLMSLHSANHLRKDTFDFWCSKAECKYQANITWQLEHDLSPGPYYIRAYDIGSKQYVRAYFEVVVE